MILHDAHLVRIIPYYLMLVDGPELRLLLVLNLI